MLQMLSEKMSSNIYEMLVKEGTYATYRRYLTLLFSKLNSQTTTLNLKKQTKYSVRWVLVRETKKDHPGDFIPYSLIVTTVRVKSNNFFLGYRHRCSSTFERYGRDVNGVRIQRKHLPDWCDSWYRYKCMLYGETFQLS